VLSFNELLLASGATLTTCVTIAYCKGKHVGLNCHCSLSSLLGHIFLQCKNSSYDKTIWNQDNRHETVVGPDLHIHEVLQYV